MNNKKIRNILDQHHIENRESSGRVYAVNAWTQNGRYYEELEDVTDYTKSELYAWLGY